MNKLPPQIQFGLFAFTLIVFIVAVFFVRSLELDATIEMIIYLALGVMALMDIGFMLYLFQRRNESDE